MIFVEAIAYEYLEKSLLNKNRETLTVIGAVSAIIATTCTIALITISFLITNKIQTPDIEAYITMINENPTLNLMEAIFGILGGAFVIPASIGFLFFLKIKIDERKRKILILPTITLILGSVLLIALYSIKINIIYELAPSFVAAIEPEKTQILTQFNDLNLVTDILQSIAYVFIYTLGAGTYGLLTIKIVELKGTIGWSAITSGVFALGVFGIFIDGTFGAILHFGAQIGAIMFFFWLISMAYAILFLKREAKKR